MPLVGLGTYRIKDPGVIRTVIKEGLSAGYRLIDTASAYRNEQEIGKILREIFDDPTSGIKREDIFITSKIAPFEQGYEECLKAVNEIFSRLDVAYIDQILIHWPGKGGILPSSPANQVARLGTWKALNRLYSLPPIQYENLNSHTEFDDLAALIKWAQPVSKDAIPSHRLVRSIGVSNFTSKHLKEFIDSDLEIPHVHQFEFHPLYPMLKEDEELHKKYKIQIVSYSPFGTGALVDERRLQYLPELDKLSVTPSRALLQWISSKGAVVIPKSITPSRIRQNFEDATSQQFSSHDLAILDDINSSRRHKFTWDPQNVN